MNVPLTPPPDSGLEVFDLEAIAHGGVETPKPSVAGLLYPAAVHSVCGEPGMGKSWFALSLVMCSLGGGIAALILDYEDSALTATRRLGEIGWRFTHGAPLYIKPTAAIDAMGVSWLTRLVRHFKVGLVVIDSVAEAMTLHGLDENSSTDVTSWFQDVPRKFAKTGASVLVVDHVTKATGKGRGRWARGSGAKLAAIDGVAYNLECVEPFSRDRSGHSTLRVAKDRHGAVGAMRELVRTVRFEVASGSLHAVRLEPYIGEGLGSSSTPKTERLTPEDVAAVLSDSGGVWNGLRAAAEAMKCSPTVANARLDEAVQAGVIDMNTEDGGRRVYRLAGTLPADFTADTVADLLENTDD